MRQMRALNVRFRNLSGLALREMQMQTIRKHPCALPGMQIIRRTDGEVDKLVEKLQADTESCVTTLENRLVAP